MPSGFLRTTVTSIGANPGTAVAAVKGRDVKPTLAEAWTGDPSRKPRFPNFCEQTGQFQASALLMLGITEELKGGLLYASSASEIEAFWSSGDLLLVWYLRCTDDRQDKTLVLIAPKRRFLDVKDDDPQKNYLNQGRGQGWKYMGHSDEDTGTQPYHGLSLDFVRHNMLPKAKGEKAWL